MKISDFTIIIDTQEQLHYDFSTIKPLPLIKHEKLKTGDYSIQGLESEITVERKTLSDLFGSLGKGRNRFHREFQRMSEMKYAVLMIENDYETMFSNPPSHSTIMPKKIFRSLIAWSQRYGVHVWPMWSRESAEKATYLILKRYWDDCLEGYLM